MKSIAQMRDLEAFGIRPLTGEADNLSYRVLCDLTEEGRATVAEAFGIGTVGFPDNWNSGAVASVMLSPSALKQIAPIALIRAGCHTVFNTKNGTVWGLEHGESIERGEWGADGVELSPTMLTMPGDDPQRWPVKSYGKIGRYFTFGSGSRQGTRNVHAMSGRVE